MKETTKIDLIIDEREYLHGMLVFALDAGAQDLITDFPFAGEARMGLGGQPYAFTHTSDGNAAI